MFLNSVSNSRLHCCLAALLLFILVFLSLPLLLIYLANTDYEDQENAFVWTRVSQNTSSLLNSSEVCNQSDVDQSFQCPEGEFACHSCPGICIKQSQNCDGFYDCPDRSDENSECHDGNGALRKIMQEIIIKANLRKSSEFNSSSNGTSFIDFGNTYDYVPKPESCSLEDFRNDRCKCDFTDRFVIHCTGQQKKRIPNTLLSSVHKILMSNNSISSIEKVLWPAALTTLGLRDNQIELIGNSTFALAPKIVRLQLSNNRISRIEPEAFSQLSSLTNLNLEYNRLASFDTKLLRRSQRLYRLCLSQNQIDLPDETSFAQFKQMGELILDHNRISRIRAHWFSNMSSLYWLTLSHNDIEYIEENSFEWNYALIELNLAYNKISVLSRLLFATNLNIQRLYLDQNPLATLPEDAFMELKELKSLNLTGIIFEHIHRNTFSVLRKLDFVYFEKFHYCHYANHSRVCRPITDGVSSSKNLLAFPILKYAVWIVAFVCLLGNVFVLVWRSVSSREDRNLSLFIRNLSLADLIMGFYLTVIGAYNLKFEGQFKNHAIEWMLSWNCKSIGFLAILSSELSVFILLIITVERYRSIVRIKPLEEYQQAGNRARLYMALAWLLSFLIAIYPFISWPLQDPTNHYYATNGLCLPLYIDEPYIAGWQYSAFVYLGLNFCAVLLIVSMYLRMYILIMSGRQSARPACQLKAEGREDAVLAMRFFLIVITDCVCWIPIVVIKIYAMKVSISSAIYGWLVVFIIPINSALNPIIYTLAAPTSLRSALGRFVERACCWLDRCLLDCRGLWPQRPRRHSKGCRCSAARHQHSDVGSSSSESSCSRGSASSGTITGRSLDGLRSGSGATGALEPLVGAQTEVGAPENAEAHAARKRASDLNYAAGFLQAGARGAKSRPEAAGQRPVHAAKKSLDSDWGLLGSQNRWSAQGRCYLASRRSTADHGPAQKAPEPTAGDAAALHQSQVSFGSSKDSRTCLLAGQTDGGAS